MNIDALIRLSYDMLDETDLYLKKVYEKKYDNKFLELEYSRGRKKYELICSLLRQINLPNPKSIYENCLDLNQFKSILKELLYKIVGYGFKDDIETYTSLIKCSNEPFIDDDTITTMTNIHNYEMPTELKVSNNLNHYSLGGTAKAEAKIMIRPLYQNFDKTIMNIHYEDIIPMLIQYIFLYELSNLLHTKKNIEINYQEKMIITLSGMLKNGNPINELYKKAGGYLFERSKQVDEWEQHSIYSSILTEIFCNSLMEYYHNDPEAFKIKLNSLMTGKISMKDYLSYYNLSLNNDTSNKYIKKIELISKD